MTSSLNTYIPTAALSIVALELSTDSVEQAARSKCCAKACILVGMCYDQLEQGCTYTHCRKRSSHRPHVATKQLPEPSLSVAGDPWTASDGGFCEKSLRGRSFIYAISKQWMCKIRNILVFTRCRDAQILIEAEIINPASDELASIHITKACPCFIV
jgi:hypothetical protein